MLIFKDRKISLTCFKMKIKVPICICIYKNASNSVYKLLTLLNNENFIDMFTDDPSLTYNSFDWFLEEKSVL